jgi:argininosuccinate synthase
MMCWQDLKREFVTELIYPAVQANAIYEVSLR